MPNKKLIEVALPLEAINKASAKEKSIRHGHPSTLHLWWARRPLAACRAVLFASLVDDPSSHPEEFPTEEAQERERQRLFRIIEDLVIWKNSNDPDVLAAARREIMRSTGGNPPPVLDPFCGGGSIPLEAQRLGLEAHGSDLNPVPVLITKALIEIPPKFAGQSPVNPVAIRELGTKTWQGAQGLADDVRYYGAWMREQAEERIGHLYPKVRLPKERGGGEATVIAWLWARTVTCPNPACGATMPLVRSFSLSTKAGKKAWVEPRPDRAAKCVHFEVREGNGIPPDGTVDRRGARCLVCGTAVPLDHVRQEGKDKRMGAQLMAIVAEGVRTRLYLPPTPEHERIAASAQPEWEPDTELPREALGFRVQNYGMTRHADLFTPRQLTALTTFSDLVPAAAERARCDALTAGRSEEEAKEYGDAVATYLGITSSKAARFTTMLATWRPDETKLSRGFTRNDVAMTWDFAETNLFSSTGGDLAGLADGTASVLDGVPASLTGTSSQSEAGTAGSTLNQPMVSTDPPYYDNVPYADLSDYFYVWLRGSLLNLYPDLFRTMLTPKAEELVADSFRHGGREQAARFFEEGMIRVFRNLRSRTNPDYPLTVYYAFKQAESEETGSGLGATASTGWETMLQGLLEAGFQVTGTWPIKTEGSTRMRSFNSNALASSIVLVCRTRPDATSPVTRRAFEAELRRELPGALTTMMRENIAPVDLAQAAIGPGMTVFSKYPQVRKADGTPMRVREALQVINQELDRVLSEHDAAYDADTRFCIAWYEQRGLNEGPFGEADVLARAKDTSVAALVESGALHAVKGKARLLRRDELPANWDPRHDSRRTLWECTQHLVRALEVHKGNEKNKEGEDAAGALAARMGGQREEAKNLAYRLFTLCERKGWTDEAIAYNNLIVAWPSIQEKANNLAQSEGTVVQLGLPQG